MLSKSVQCQKDQVLFWCKPNGRNIRRHRRPPKQWRLTPIVIHACELCSIEIGNRTIQSGLFQYKYSILVAMHQLWFLYVMDIWLSRNSFHCSMNENLMLRGPKTVFRVCNCVSALVMHPPMWFPVVHVTTYHLKIAYTASASSVPSFAFICPSFHHPSQAETRMHRDVLSHSMDCLRWCVYLSNWNLSSYCIF